MNTHEYQARQVLDRFGIPTPPFRVAENQKEVQKAIEELNLDAAVVKVQVHAGGRGKAGGVKLAKSKEEILQVADNLIGMKIVNNQTGPEGNVAKKVLLGPITDIEKEYYLGIVIDRKQALPTLIASAEGGTEIEEVAVKTPEKVLTLPIYGDKLRSYQLLYLCKFMGWSGSLAKQGRVLAQNLVRAFFAIDAQLLEINPLVRTPDGDLTAIDAKLSIDDNALFRQQELVKDFDFLQLPSREARAKKFDLQYIALSGNIGCMVNGAGLAMATMDIIQHYGGTPANFLDVGGGATKEKVAEGFKIILEDSEVEAILVNIFGGIMNCETLAEGILEAAKQVTIHVPLVVRMEGTSVEEGRKMLNQSGLSIIVAKSLDEAAQKACSEAAVRRA